MIQPAPTTAPDERSRFTRLLDQLRAGDEDAFDELLPVVYDALKDIARRQLSLRRRSEALCTTELVHEAYFKLSGQAARDWQDRVHFCGIAANAMRQVLVDQARRRNAAKRGGGADPITLTAGLGAVEPNVVDVLALDQALDRLGRLNERLRRVVEYLFFGGMTQEEVAAVLGVSTRTVERDWLKAKLFLHRELHAEGA
ncbi:MAG TPA: ECF-type sigma factor [Longimicrobiales bacterium]